MPGPADGVEPVVGEAPTRVERNAEAGHGASGQGRLEPEMARDRVDLGGRLDHRPRLHGLRDRPRPRGLDVRPGEMALAPDPGRRIQDHHAVGVGMLGGGDREHGGEGRLAGEAEADGRVPRHLIDDDDEGPRPLPEEMAEIDPAGVVVEAEVGLPQETDAGGGAGKDVLALPAALLQHRLQFARGGGVVVDAEPIDDGTQGPQRPGAGQAQEAFVPAVGMADPPGDRLASQAAHRAAPGHLDLRERPGPQALELATVHPSVIHRRSC